MTDLRCKTHVCAVNPHAQLLSTSLLSLTEGRIVEWHKTG